MSKPIPTIFVDGFVLEKNMQIRRRGTTDWRLTCGIAHDGTFLTVNIRTGRQAIINGLGPNIKRYEVKLHQGQPEFYK